MLGQIALRCVVLVTTWMLIQGQPNNAAAPSGNNGPAADAAPAATTAAPEAATKIFKLLPVPDKTSPTTAPPRPEEELNIIQDLNLMVEDLTFQTHIWSEPLVLTYVVNLSLPSDGDLFSNLTAIGDKFETILTSQFHTTVGKGIATYNVCIGEIQDIVTLAVNLQTILTHARRYANFNGGSTPSVKGCTIQTGRIAVIDQVQRVIPLLDAIHKDFELYMANRGTLKDDSSRAWAAHDTAVHFCNVVRKAADILQHLVTELTALVAQMNELSNGVLPSIMLYQLDNADCLQLGQQEITSVIGCINLPDEFRCEIHVKALEPGPIVATILPIPIRILGVNLQLTPLEANLAVETATGTVVDLTKCTKAQSIISCQEKPAKLSPHFCYDAVTKGDLSDILLACQIQITPDQPSWTKQVAAGTLIAVTDSKPIVMQWGKRRLKLDTTVLIVHRESLRITSDGTSTEILGNLAVSTEEYHALRFTNEGLFDLYARFFAAYNWIQQHIPVAWQPYVFASVGVIMLLLCILALCICQCIFKCFGFDLLQLLRAACRSLLCKCWSRTRRPPTGQSPEQAPPTAEEVPLVHSAAPSVPNPTPPAQSLAARLGAIAQGTPKSPPTHARTSGRRVSSPKLSGPAQPVPGGSKASPLPKTPKTILKRTSIGFDDLADVGPADQYDLPPPIDSGSDATIAGSSSSSDSWSCD